jgi:DNA polymerase-3 subunit alpha
LDGLSKPHQIANRCLEIGATSCALTDHGSISGAIQFYSEMNKKGIKPILGCEIYVCDQDASIKTKENGKLSHLLILAKNLNGWKDLIKVISISNYGDNFYKKPRLDLDTLGSIISKNMLCITGHLGSSLANTILDNDHISSDSHKNSNNHLNKLIDVFGRENIFLESQLIDQENLPIQVPLTSYIRDLGKKFGIKVICTPDAHYCRKEDAVDQRILLCNNLKTTLSEINRKLNNDDDVGMSCFFTSDNFHIPTFEEMKSLHTEEEIQNTLFASSMCEEYDIMSKPMLPPFDYPKSYDSDDEYVRQLCRNGWKQKLSGNITKEQENIYADRIKYELGVLQGAGLSSYFLIVNDIVNYVKDNNWLPGPGRGSAAGCLVSYLLGITSIDPIKYNLMFDRFYNAGRNTKDRISMPDIDIDVPINKREDIINYIKNKYGHKKVSQMITFNTMKGRGALKDVLRA